MSDPTDTEPVTENGALTDEAPGSTSGGTTQPSPQTGPLLSRPGPYNPDASLSPTITVGREWLPQAIKHGCELFWSGSTPTKRLDERDDSDLFTRFVNARIEGKLAEVAVMEFLEDVFGVRSAVDWRIYGDYTETDDGDLQHLIGPNGETYELGMDLEVKKTKPWNSWLAIRDEIFTKLDPEAPVILTKLRIESDLTLTDWETAGDWDAVDADEAFRERLLEFADAEFPLKVDIVGTAYPDEFTDQFDQGDRLYDPETGRKLGPPLKRPNHGIHVDELDDRVVRWNRTVAELLQSLPADDRQHAWRPLPVVDT